jgi:hypothetical protein
MHPGLWKHPVGVQVIEGEDELLVLPESSNAPILCFSFMVTHTHGLSSTNFG